MSVVSNRESPGHPSPEIERAPQAAAPSDRVSLDWWQLPSISGTCLQPTFGESRHQAEIGSVARRWPTRNVTAQLLAEPTNPHDRHAVMVLLDGYKVGYLSGDRDPRFTALVRHLAVTQGPVRARARITGGDGLPWGVTLHAVPEPFDQRVDFLTGPRLEPVHCSRSQRQLGDELALLAPLAAELRVGNSSDPARGGQDVVGHDRHTGPIDRVHVLVQGHRVGVLDAAASAEYLPLVRSAATRGFAPTCRVVVQWPSTDPAEEIGSILHTEVPGPDVSGGVEHVSTLRLALLRHPTDLADVCS